MICDQQCYSFFYPVLKRPVLCLDWLFNAVLTKEQVYFNLMPICIRASLPMRCIHARLNQLKQPNKELTPDLDIQDFQDQNFDWDTAEPLQILWSIISSAPICNPPHFQFIPLYNLLPRSDIQRAESEQSLEIEPLYNWGYEILC